MDLEEVGMFDGPSLANTLRVPFTYCWSPALVPKPTDWPSYIDVSGFFWREPPDYEPPLELRSFIEGGPPPVYIGFGSIVLDDPERITAAIIEAVTNNGFRAIVSRGWSNLGSTGESHKDVIFIGDCPHEWLFQHVAAVVHHGGAGTTACGLRNGRPTAIVPFFGE
jgi:UDP:flavonoid glycosyltransferase YjiC (YdhE family)